MKAENIEHHIRRILKSSNEGELQEHLKKAQELKRRNFGEKISFYAPSFMYYRSDHYRSSPADFPTISVTGQSCALRCKHCGGKVLNTMYSATTPKRLLDICRQLEHEGAIGCLVSGGCLPNGSVPLKEFVGTLGEIKRELGLTILVHTGIVDFDTAAKLRNAGVDAALIDIIGSEETIKEIYRLNVTVKAYEDSLKSLHEAGIAFVPHVIVGLNYGKLKGELSALQMISRYQPAALVIIAFMPIPGTEMEKVEPPKPLDIAKVMATARLMFPQTPISLGCMRPKGQHRIETDALAIRSGVNAIAFPTEEAIELARKLGYKVTFSSLCCSQVYS